MTFDQLFSSTTIILVPLLAFGALILLTIPGMMVQGAEPRTVLRAASCVIMEALGVALIVISAAQIIYSLLVMTLPEFPLLGILLVLLAVGLGIVAHESRALGRLEKTSALLPHLVFCHTIEFTGITLALFAAMSYISGVFMMQNIDGWQLPATLILLGVGAALITSLHLSKISVHDRKVSKKKS